jgi:hypothetical protein
MSETATEHLPEDAAVIASVLVSCTLGHRIQPELRMDLLGHITRLGADCRRFAESVGQSLLPVMQEMARAVSAIVPLAATRRGLR